MFLSAFTPANRLEEPVKPRNHLPGSSSFSHRSLGLLPILLWCGLAIAVGAKAIVSPTRHNVWPVFATASNHWWQNAPPYAHYLGLDTYRYSPTFAVAVTPLARLPLSLGGCLWGVGCVGLLFGALSRLHRDVLADSLGLPDRSAFLALAAIAVAPMAWNLQSNIVLLALIAYGTAAAATGKWWTAAFALVTPVFIKLWPAAWLAVVVLGKPRSLGIRAIAAFAAFAALPLLSAPPERVVQVYSEWIASLSRNHGQRWPGYRDAITILNAVGLTANTSLYRLMQLTGGLAVLAAAALVRRTTASDRRGLAVGLLAWTCWQLLLGPGSERNTYGLVLPFMVWETLRMRRRGGFWLFPAAALAVVFLLNSGDVERALAKVIPGAAAILPAAVAVFPAGLAIAAVFHGAARSATVVGPVRQGSSWDAAVRTCRITSRARSAPRPASSSDPD